jgi:hypothetical protein
MRNFLMSVAALTAILAAPSVASADDVSDRSQAIQFCRTQISSQTGVDADAVRLDQVRVRPHSVRADFDLWRHGQLQNVRCEVPRGQELSVATITPPLQTSASAGAPAAQ